MKTTIELIKGFLELLKQLVTTNKAALKIQSDSLDSRLKNMEHLEPEVARAVLRRYSELSFEDVFGIKTKSMFYAHINYLYENSLLSYKTIKSAFPVLRKKDGKLLSSLGTPEWLLGKLIFLVGYSLIVAGFGLVLYLDRTENDFFKYKLMVTVGGCWFFGFPLMFLSVPFYNASLVSKFIAEQDGEEFNDDKLYKMVFARCRKRLINSFLVSSV